MVVMDVVVVDVVVVDMDAGSLELMYFLWRTD